MAKRAMNHSEAIPQNDCDFITNVGVYRGYNDTKNMNNDDIGTIVVSLPWDYNSRQQIVFVAGGKHIFHRAKTPASWGEYTEIAQCVAPEVHGLPLNIAGDINTSHYSRDQFGRVFVSIRVRSNTHWSEMKTIGTMPEGFRPDWDIVVPALVQSYGNLFRAEQLFITSTGAIITQGDYSDVDLIFAQLTYPAAT